jgi:hypothetical protein
MTKEGTSCCILKGRDTSNSNNSSSSSSSSNSNNNNNNNNNNMNNNSVRSLDCLPTEVSEYRETLKILSQQLSTFPSIDIDTPF